ncbi:hypothetical protein [Nitrosomonas sp. ANs5]|uniref:hypothetical protein n=1 Tax=Nitrosomonas sp. ANs5 TaxID=3423941 RepID=UPI003D32EE76
MREKIVACLSASILFALSMQLAAAPAAPVLTYSTSGFTVTASWTRVPGATEYKLNYAPYPCAGPNSISSLNVGSDTSFSATLWNGAAFYIAVQAGDKQGFSEYSNIEYFIISQSSADLTGNWGMVETAGPNSCGIGAGLQNNYITAINQAGTFLTAQLETGLLKGSLAGNTLKLSGTLQDAGTNRAYKLYLTVSPDGREVSGSASWKLTSSHYKCSGVSSITGLRQY